MPLLFALFLCCWLIEDSLCSYQLRPRVTFTDGAADSEDVLNGKFAGYAESSTAVVAGTMVVLDETYGCPESNATLRPPPTRFDFIVVIPLSSCDDYLQARRAEGDGASGVVFYYKSDFYKTSLEGSGSELDIMVALVAPNDLVLSHIEGSDKRYASVTIQGVPVHSLVPQSRTFYFIVTAFCVLILLSCLWFFTNYARRCRHSIRNRRRQVSKRRSILEPHRDAGGWVYLLNR